MSKLYILFCRLIALKSENTVGVNIFNSMTLGFDSFKKKKIFLCF